MQPVDLNLASRPFKNDTLLWVGLVSIVAALAYASWWNVDSFATHKGMLADLELKEATIEDRVAALDLRSKNAVETIDDFELGTIELKAHKANGVIRWKAFSWTQLFNLLQEVQPHNVQMFSIVPTFRGGDARAGLKSLEDLDQVPVAVEGVAKSLADFLAFERELIFSPHFDRIEPDRHTLDETTREIVFRLRFLYDPRVAMRLETERRAAAEALAQAQPEAVEVGDDAALEAAEGLAELSAGEQEPAVERAAAVGAEAAEAEEGVLATEDLKKIDRRGKRRGKKSKETTPEEDPAEPPLAQSNDKSPEGMTEKEERP